MLLEAAPFNVTERWRGFLEAQPLLEDTADICRALELAQARPCNGSAESAVSLHRLSLQLQAVVGGRDAEERARQRWRAALEEVTPSWGSARSWPELVDALVSMLSSRECSPMEMFSASELRAVHEMLQGAGVPSIVLHVGEDNFLHKKEELAAKSREPCWAFVHIHADSRLARPLLVELLEVVQNAQFLRATLLRGSRGTAMSCAAADLSRIVTPSPASVASKRQGKGYREKRVERLYEKSGEALSQLVRVVAEQASSTASPAHEVDPSSSG
jgi:hypothetical protein